MSGGYFDYQQYKIREIADQIKEVIIKNKVEKQKEELYPWCYNDDGTVNEWDKYYFYFPDDVIEEFKKTYKALRIAEIYAHRCDYLLEGDDSEESFKNRLKKELEEFELEFSNGKCFSDLDFDNED